MPFWKTYWVQWMIRTDGERKSGKSVLSAQFDTDDYTHTKHTGRKDKINSFTHTNISFFINILVVLKEYTCIFFHKKAVCEKCTKWKKGLLDKSNIAKWLYNSLARVRDIVPTVQRRSAKRPLEWVSRTVI